MSNLSYTIIDLFVLFFRYFFTKSSGRDPLKCNELQVRGFRTYKSILEPSLTLLHFFEFYNFLIFHIRIPNEQYEY